MSSHNYIRNRGSTQTIIKNKHQKQSFNDIHWDVNYNGKQAKVKVDMNDNGKNFKINANLDNNDLAQLLNIPAIKGDLNERLQNDFLMQDDSLQEIPMIKLTPRLNENDDKMLLQLMNSPMNSPMIHMGEMDEFNDIDDLLVKPEKLVPDLKYQPFLRPLKKQKTRVTTTTKNTKKRKLVGKTGALKYRTPSPKTFRIRLKTLSNPLKKRSSTKKSSKSRKPRKTLSIGEKLFRDIF